MGKTTTQSNVSIVGSWSMLHMNWGWGPDLSSLGGVSNNGWYNCSIDYTTSPSVNGNFQYFQTVIHNIHP